LRQLPARVARSVAAPAVPARRRHAARERPVAVPGVHGQHAARGLHRQSAAAYGAGQQAPGAQALADGGHEGAGGGGQGCAAASGALPVITRRKRTADLSVCAHAAEPRGRERPPTDCGGASALQRPSQRVCGLQRDQTSKDVPCALVARPRRGRGARAAPATRGRYDKGAARARCCARSSTHAPECVPL
jgi:hypothetical protein